MWRGHAFLHIHRIVKKNTAEKMSSDQFCSHFYKQGQINLNSWPDCCNCIADSIDTHIGHILCHMAKCKYGHMAKIGSYGHIAIWPCGNEHGQYGCLLKQLYKCSNLAKSFSWFDLVCRNGSKIGPMTFFPLYFFGQSFVYAKRGGHATDLLGKLWNFFWWLIICIHSPG